VTRHADRTAVLHGCDIDREAIAWDREHLAHRRSVLAELRRVSRPGGTLLLTSHGPDLVPPAATAQREQLARTGFAYKQGGGTPGLPDFYHTSFHTEAKVRSSWGRWFDVVRFVPRGLNRHQDLVVLRTPARG
jgi:hypothetical protein